MDFWKIILVNKILNIDRKHFPEQLQRNSVNNAWAQDISMLYIKFSPAFIKAIGSTSG